MVEQTVNVDPDGSTTFEGAEDATGGAEGEAFEETMEEIVEAGVDPAIFLLVGFIVVAVLYFLYNRKNKSDEDDYFSSYEKVSGEQSESHCGEQCFPLFGQQKVSERRCLVGQQSLNTNCNLIQFPFCCLLFSVQYQAPFGG